jgi:hypothetical protein
MASTLTKVLMGTDFPEELAMQGGTRMQLESSIQSSETGPTGMSSGRFQHSIKVDINRARRFQYGQAYVIRKGYAMAVQISECKLSEEQRAVVPSEPQRQAQVLPPNA